MGRLGDASDVHAAFVEFRAKEGDKCLSAQCIYCQSVRAKNTSRQRAHLMECQPYLDAMKEHNPQSAILELASNPQPTPPKNPKKRDFDAVVSGFQGNDLGGMGRAVPKPNLARDMQIIIQLNPRIDIGATIYGERNWVSFISGHWQAQWGKGTVVPGGQAQQLLAQDLSTRVQGTYLLQTHDVPPAFVSVRTEGWRVGPRDVLEKLGDPAQVDGVEPKSYSFRLYVHMETGHPKYLQLNTGMWIGSGVQRASEIVMDAYRVL